MPRKLNLSSIKVRSFVTSLEKEEKSKVKGGNSYEDCTFTCETYCRTCETCQEQTCAPWECWP